MSSPTPISTRWTILQGIIEQNLETRKRAAAQAEVIVQEERDGLWAGIAAELG